MSKYWTVYCATNAVNGKKYIGLTRWFKSRISAHKAQTGKHATKVLSSAFAKYGFDNFVFEQIASCRSREDACATEIHLIADRNTRVPYGYNVTVGGEGAGGYKQSPESIEKRVLHLRGKKRPAHLMEALRRYSIGRKPSAETRLKMSLARLGKKQSPESIEKGAAKRRGTRLSQEQIFKITVAQRGISRPYASALARKTMTGRKWSPELREKMGPAISAGKRNARLLMFMEYAGMY